MPQTGGRQFAQTLGKLDYRLMCEASQHHMLQRLKLVAQRRVDARIAMPKQIHPPGTDRVQIAVAIVIMQPYARTARDRHQRKTLVMFHLRARMPNGGEAAREKAGVGWGMILHKRNHNGFCGLPAG